MDDYTREMMDLKTLVTRTLEKKGVLAKIRAELRASVFEAIEEEDKAIEKDEGLPPALLGSCNDRAKRLHASPSGRLITALICEYLDWAQLGHTLKVYLPECNLQKDAWKAELRDFSNKNGYDINRNGDSGPLLLDVLEGFLKFENQSQGRSNLDSRNRRPSSSSVVGGLAPLGRQGPGSQTSERKGGSSKSSYRNDDYNWRYENDDNSEDINRASVALENLQLDRKARSLTTSWRFVFLTLGNLKKLPLKEKLTQIDPAFRKLVKMATFSFVMVKLHKSVFNFKRFAIVCIELTNLAFDASKF